MDLVKRLDEIIDSMSEGELRALMDSVSDLKEDSMTIQEYLGSLEAEALQPYQGTYSYEYQESPISLESLYLAA